VREGQAVAGLDKAVGARVGLDAGRSLGCATDDIVRAIDVRLRVFDAGRVLMTRESS
jgi:hypothetical protein